MRVSVLLLITFLLYCDQSLSQVVINEICPSNVNTISNVEGKFDDWIEIFNSGNSTVNLQGFSITDDITDADKFIFPSVDLGIGKRLVLFASDENHIPVNHYEMAVNGSSQFRYVPGSPSLDTNWRNLSYNDQSWALGAGGIGYNDGDDVTEIPNTVSLMMRRTFTLADTSEILNAVLMMDYDDGFVAYINGEEIAKANMPSFINRPEWNLLALGTHEAQVYLGGKPDSIYIDHEILRSVLKEGVNVFAIEVHDYSPNPTDMSSKPFLFFGMKSSVLNLPPPPAWFVTSTDYFSADFKLNSDGETVYLLNAAGNVIDQHAYTSMMKDHSFGRIPDGSANWCFMNTPSPGNTNNGALCYLGYSESPVISPDGGFYNNQQTVSMSCAPGGTIRYTVNGDEPDVNDPVYSAPLIVTASQTVRARVFRSNYLPGPAVTRTFFINVQSHLPVFSLTTDSLNLWDYNTGIYVLGPNAQPDPPNFGANFWQDWLKPGSIEYFDKSKQRLFAFDAGLQIYGNYSRYKPQKSFEIKLHDYDGLGEINYPLISDKSFITKYDRIILRNAGTDWNVVHFRDALMQRLMKNCYSDYVAAEPVRVFLNGADWGVYLLNEKHNQNWIENNYGYDKDDINYLEEIGNDIVVGEGSDESYWDMYEFITSQAADADGYFEEVSSMLDVRNFADYMIAETYYNNGDWIGEWTNNIKLWKRRGPAGKWKYIMIDTDYGFGLRGQLTDNRLEMARNPMAFSHTSEMFDALLENDSFRTYFINRYADLINTIYLPANVERVKNEFRDSMSFDMFYHFQKWGHDTAAWTSNISSMMEFVSERPQIMRDYIQDDFNLAGQVVLSLDVSPAGAGRIEISTVIPDTLPWSGVYYHGNPVRITAIPNPGYTFDHWSSASTIHDDHSQRVSYDFATDDQVTAYFTGSPRIPQLTVSEFNYHSAPDYKADDWIELHNYGNFDLDISGWRIGDGETHTQFTFPVLTVIPANGYLVLPEDSAQFSTLYPNVTNRSGEINFDLNNSSDHIIINDYRGGELLSFQYDDNQPWPALADGAGYTCELHDPLSDLSDGTNWFAGCFGGSPGKGFSNELATVTDIHGKDYICSGGNSVLSTLYVPSFTYQWKQNASDIQGAVTDSLNINSAGVYNVFVSCNGCSAESEDFSVSERNISAAPAVRNDARCNAGAIQLSASAEDSVYWFDSPGGQQLGAGKFFTTELLQETKTYYAVAGNICPSNPVAVIAEITHGDCDDFSVYPNPSQQDAVVLHSDEFESGTAMLIVSDMKGAVMYKNEIQISPAGNSQLFSLALGNGIYTFAVFQDDNVYNVKYVRTK